MSWHDYAGLLLAFLGGFVAWRILELIQLAGARMRNRMLLTELRIKNDELSGRLRRLRELADWIDPVHVALPTISHKPELEQAERFDLDADPITENDGRS